MVSMGSGIDSPSGLDSSSSLELALDQAIARRWASVQDRPGRKRRMSPYPAALGLTYTPTPALPRATSTALTVPSRDTALALAPTRLRWRGIEVSEEFQAYAARVARGEQLAPYRGPVLSRACAEFPWSAAPSAFLPPPASPPVYPERGRALKTTLWVTAAMASIVGALGVGAGAASVPDHELGASVQSAALALKPAPVTADETLASSDESDSGYDADPLPPSLDTEPPAALAAAANRGPLANASVKPSVRRAVSSPRPLPSDVPRTPEAPASSAPNSVNAAPRLTIPPATSVPFDGSARPSTVATAARATAQGEDSSGRGSPLFSDQAPF